MGRLAGLEPASHGLPRSQIVRGGCADRWHITPHSRFLLGTYLVGVAQRLNAALKAMLATL